MSSNGKVIGVLVGGIGLGAVLGAAGMNLFKTKAGSRFASGAAGTCSVEGASNSSAALFELDGKSYSRDDLPTDVKDTLFQIQNQSFESTANFAKEVALRMALAQDSGEKVDATSLPQLKNLLKSDKVSDDELKKFYEANKQSIPPGTSFDQIKPQLEQFLVAQKVGEVARTRVAELQEKGRLKLLVTPPIAPVVQLNVEPYPSKGASDARVTLVEVSDYLCPHCRTMKPEIEEALKEHGSKVKFVQINFALRPQGLSGALARGGYCAQQQGGESFWKYHDKAFAVPLEAAQPVSPDANKEFTATATTAAKDAGLDVAAFDKCLNSDEAKKAVETASASMNALGVTGTPTFFLNNRKLTLGTVSIAQAIKTELDGPAAANAGSKAN